MVFGIEIKSKEELDKNYKRMCVVTMLFQTHALALARSLMDAMAQVGKEDKKDLVKVLPQIAGMIDINQMAVNLTNKSLTDYLQDLPMTDYEIEIMKKSLIYMNERHQFVEDNKLV